MFVIGILDCIPGRPSGVTWAESSLMLVWNFFYDISIGPVCFVLISECSATRVRSKSIAVATAAQAVLGIIMTVAIPYMINPDQADMKGKLGFLYGGLGVLCTIWSYYRVPETMGRTYGKLGFTCGALVRNTRGLSYGYPSANIRLTQQLQRSWIYYSTRSCLRESSKVTRSNRLSLPNASSKH